MRCLNFSRTGCSASCGSPQSSCTSAAATFSRRRLPRRRSRPSCSRPPLATRPRGRNLRLVVYIARRFENTGVNIEDLISIGTIGLIKAVGTFKSDRNIKLATYASRCIENEILMHIRKIAGQKAEVSLDEPINTDWDGNELLLSDVLGTDGDIVMRPMEEDAEQQLLREALARLPERERRIVSLRFGLGGRPEKTQKEVADLLGISQSYISRLEKRIMQRLRRDLLRQVS